MEINIIKGKVVKILDEYRIIVNLGIQQGVKNDMKFIVYSEGDWIRDPDSQVVLGRLENIKTRVKPLHIQENISIMETYEKEINKLAYYMSGSSTPSDRVERQKPFIIESTTKKGIDPKLIIRVGDLVRQDFS